LAKPARTRRKKTPCGMIRNGNHNSKNELQPQGKCKKQPGYTGRKIPPQTVNPLGRKRTGGEVVAIVDPELVRAIRDAGLVRGGLGRAGSYQGPRIKGLPPT